MKLIAVYIAAFVATVSSVAIHLDDGSRHGSKRDSQDDVDSESMQSCRSLTDSRYRNFNFIFWDYIDDFANPRDGICSKYSNDVATLDGATFVKFCARDRHFKEMRAMVNYYNQTMSWLCGDEARATLTEMEDSECYGEEGQRNIEISECEWYHVRDCQGLDDYIACVVDRAEASCGAAVGRFAEVFLQRWYYDPDGIYCPLN